MRFLATALLCAMDGVAPPQSPPVVGRAGERPNRGLAEPARLLRPASGHAAEIAVYVASGWCGQGVGRALLQHALREAPRWSVDRFMAFIWHDNITSRGLFRSQGFVAWGSLPGVVWAEGRSRDMLILGLELAA